MGAKPESGTVKVPVAVNTSPEPDAATAEVVSHEIVPCSATESSHASELLPPPCEESVQKTSPPKSKPVTALEMLRRQQMQQLREMGFPLTLTELNEKLREHNDNMEYVVNSLLY